jgi:hypothetical protein
MFKEIKNSESSENHNRSRWVEKGKGPKNTPQNGKRKYSRAG